MSCSYEPPLGVAAMPRGTGTARGGSVGGSSANAGAAAPNNRRTTAPAITAAPTGPRANLFLTAAQPVGGHRYSGDLLSPQPGRQQAARSSHGQTCDALDKRPPADLPVGAQRTKSQRATEVVVSLIRHRDERGLAARLPLRVGRRGAAACAPSTPRRGRRRGRAASRRRAASRPC